MINIETQTSYIYIGYLRLYIVVYMYLCIHVVYLLVKNK